MTEQLTRTEWIEPPPRRIRLKAKERKSVYVGLGCIWLFLLPFVLIGIRMPVLVLVRLYLHSSGERTTGKVMARDKETDSDTGTTYQIEYTYQVADHTYDHWESVPETSYRAVEEGMSIPVKYAPLLPGIATAALPGRSATPTSEATMFTFIWDGILSVFLYVFVVLPFRNRWLFRFGTAAAGTILRKEINEGEDSETYSLHYEFTPDTLVNVPVQGKERIEKEEWDTVQAGDTITVLYDPRHTKRNALYPFLSSTVGSEAWNSRDLKSRPH